MQQSVSHFCLVNIPRFRIGNIKSFVRTMPISFCYKIFMQQNNVKHQIPLKFLNVFSLFFAFHKFSPCVKQILNRNDIVVCIIKFGVPIVVEPVIVPVPPVAIPVEIANVQIAVRVAVYIKCLPCHCLLNTLEAVSYSAS